MNYKYVIICFGLLIYIFILYIFYVLLFTRFSCNTANVCAKHQSIHDLVLFTINNKGNLLSLCSLYANGDGFLKFSTEIWLILKESICTISVRQCNCTYLRNCVFICRLFFKYENEYSGNSFGNIVIVLYLCCSGMLENKYFDQWRLQHPLYYTLMGYLMDK
jgi:hypothetical protein